MNGIPIPAYYGSLAIFVLTYAGVLIDKSHRTIIALAGAAAMITTGAWLSFYDLSDAMKAVDFDTLTLLLGMMIIVGLFQATGFFQYIAIRSAKMARGRPWRLFLYLCVVASLVSAVLDNVSTIIILAPVTISIADILELSPLPYLVAELLLSNISGVATLIGDPPNILIASAARFSFLDVLTHLAPIVLLVWPFAFALLSFVFRSNLRVSPMHIERLLAIDERRALIDPATSRKMLWTFSATLVLFMLHEPLGLSPGLVALAGACAGLIWVRPDIDRVLKEIQWEVLLFFLALFVLVGGLGAAGVLATVGSGVAALARQGPEIAIIAVLWMGAMAAGAMSNVPLTIAVLPIFQGLATQGVITTPLWWALAIGVGFGANLTPLGSASNVVVATLSESAGTHLSLRSWLRSGTATAIISLILGSVGLLLAHWAGLL